MDAYGLVCVANLVPYNNAMARPSGSSSTTSDIRSTDPLSTLNDTYNTANSLENDPMEQTEKDNLMGMTAVQCYLVTWQGRARLLFPFTVRGFDNGEVGTHANLR